MYFHRVGKNYAKAHLVFNDPLSATLGQYYVKAYPAHWFPSPEIANYDGAHQPGLAHSFPSLAMEKRHLCCFFGFPLTLPPSGEHLKRIHWQIPQFREIILALLINRKLAA